MKEQLNTTSLCFDDILLVPKKSNISTRSEIDIKTKIGNPNNPDAQIELRLPVIIAPMENISSTAMIRYIINSGGLGFINRFKSKEDRINQLKDIKLNAGVSISSSETNDSDFIKKILEYGSNIILIDTAFGHTDIAIEAVKKLRSIVPKTTHIMTGNVSSCEAYKDLMDAGADSVRVGIGGGSACTTRLVTGTGVPVLGSVIDIYSKLNGDDVNGIISDGGINSYGDIVKAIAAGANAVMMGKMFAGHNECDNSFSNGQNNFRGLASESIQKEMIENNLMSARSLYVEGISGSVPSKGGIENTLSGIRNSIQSGLSYNGSININHFQKTSRYIRVSNQSILESNTRLN